ncbi:hypothetical protein DM860_013625 [Cuscuta australis]|uniref:ARM repeat superfamily protein n=1 Tax=Cuscuta australis TaxID=267555 RepID=A0A328EEB3_9ASTE|nr:hypothetical protein DM860_013625 [Cuscuta australis]
MRALAARLTSHILRRKPRNEPIQSYKNFSASSYGKEEGSIEEEAERKIGWLLKLIFAGTATAVAYQFFPYLGDNMMQQSVTLLRVKDPLFKRMGASRLARFAIDDERRMKIIEMGGAEELVKMLEAAKDDRTRKEALKALFAISKSVEAAAVLHRAGAISAIKSTPSGSSPDDDSEVEKYKSHLLDRFHELRYDATST